MKDYKPLTDEDLDTVVTSLDPTDQYFAAQMLVIIEQARRANAAMDRLERALKYQPVRDVDVPRLRAALAAYNGEG